MENTSSTKRVNIKAVVNRYREDNSFVFYASFYESILTQEPEVRLEIFDALCMYGCRGELPDSLSVAAAGIVAACLPQIEAAQSRYEKAGNGGGRKGVCNNPTGRRGKKNKTDDDETKQELKEQTEKQTEKTQLTETETEKQTEKTNKELNKNKPETKNRLNIEKEIEYKEEIEIKKEEQLQQQIEKEIITEKQTQLQQQVVGDDAADARTMFIDDFFDRSRLQAIERQADALGVTMEEYRSLVEQVLDDWEMGAQIPEPSPDERRHMLYTVRKKHEALQLLAQRRQAAAGRSVQSSPTTTAGSDSTLEQGRRSYEERMEAERRERNEMYDRPVLRGEALQAKLNGFNWRTGEYESPADTSTVA